MLVKSPILYLAFFKNILGALFRTLGLPLRFLPSKPSFLHDHFTTQFQFLAVSILADKPVNRSIHAYALEHFCVKGFIFFDIHRKQGRSSSNSGDKIQKKRLENILSHAHLWCGSTQIEYLSQKVAQQG